MIPLLGRFRRLVLTALGVAVGLLLSGCAEANKVEVQASAPAGLGATIAAGELAAGIARGEVLLVDVRTPEEFAAGRIAGAVNMPLDSFDPKALPRQPGKETVVYCRSGRRSAIAVKLMIQAGGEASRQLEGGTLAWEAAGLALEK